MGNVIKCVTLLLTATVLIIRKGLAYGVIVVWVLVGILAKQNEHPNSVLASKVGIVLILIAVAVTIASSRLKR